ncbi:uncharacterized protein LOC121736721 [Aricia agestis]|uniref:uncharacterized protein LOC121736721 n=1 Tax=Aricia agestis TaxID=91739 RepID=UPI001C207771|nr:uncharacterized protein LOC121736721 [Aricia agestis]
MHSRSKIFQIRADTVQRVRENVDLHRPGDIENAVRILQDWIEKQSHFRRKDFPPEYLECTLVDCKGSVERTKAVLDRVATVRSLMPDAFAPYSVREEFTTIRDHVHLLVLPQLTEEHERIGIVKVKKMKPKIMRTMYKFSFTLLDWGRLRGYWSSTVFVFDVSEGELGELMASVNVLDLRNTYCVVIESFAIRIKRMHLVTSSRLVETFLTLVRSFMRKKIADKIVINRSIEELHHYYPKDILPKDYGGYDKSLDEIQEDVLDELSSKEAVEFMEQMYERRTDEVLRPAGDFSEMYAGMAGTFRALSVD